MGNGPAVLAVDQPRRRGRGDPAPADRRRVRAGQPDRARAGHERRVHRGARPEAAPPDRAGGPVRSPCSSRSASSAARASSVGSVLCRCGYGSPGTSSRTPTCPRALRDGPRTGLSAPITPASALATRQPAAGRTSTMRTGVAGRPVPHWSRRTVERVAGPAVHEFQLHLVSGAVDVGTLDQPRRHGRAPAPCARLTLRAPARCGVLVRRARRPRPPRTPASDRPGRGAPGRRRSPAAVTSSTVGANPRSASPASASAPATSASDASRALPWA